MDIETRSFITISINELDRLYRKNANKIQMIDEERGFLSFDKVIGNHFSFEVLRPIDTNCAVIHYTKTGFFLVPCKPLKEDK